MKFNFKRAGSAVMAAVLALSMSATAFAAEAPTKDVTGSYAAGESAPVYSYSYSFGSMEFTYRDAADQVWDPETHTYVAGESKGGWSCADGANKITVVNHSNAAIKVTPSFEAAIDGMKFGFTKLDGEDRAGVMTIESAEGTTVANAPRKSVEVGPTTDCAGLEAGQAGVKLGTITLNVTPA